MYQIVLKCFHNGIFFSRENKLNSLGLGVINTTRRGYPPEEGAHIALSEF